MDVLKKLTTFITPPPFRKAPKAGPVQWREPGPSLATILKRHLVHFLAFPSLDESEAQEYLNRIKRIAQEKGFYLTAFELKNQLDTMPRSNADGKEYHKARGYVLAADFLLRHIRAELEAIKTKSQSVGPNVFSGYCHEMISCLLSGRNIMRAVEVPLFVVDELFANAVEETDKGAMYLDLASQMLESDFELVSQNLERATAEQARRTQTKGSADTPTPRPSRALTSVVGPIITYLEELHQDTKDVRSSFLDLATTWKRREEQRAGAVSPAARQVERLHDMLKALENTPYRPYRAFVSERLGALLHQAEPERARAFFSSAAQEYENQGDRERELSLRKLSGTRYERARATFLRADENERAERVQAKIAAP